MNKLIASCLTGILSLTLLQAASAESPSQREALEALYHATNGDHWHRNDGWLEEDVHWCDWYGVHCQYRSSIEDDIIWSVDLPNNNLTGELPGSLLFEHAFVRLDLSNNAIGGHLERIPASPGKIDLSNNRLEGTLPTEKSQQAGRTGNVSFGPPSSNWRLNLAGNQFSGPLPASITDTRLLMRNDGTRWGGGLNLCWNDIEIDDPDVADWVALRHVGGPDYEQCLAHDRVALDTAVSGSWYDPARSGEGIVVHRLDEGSALL